ncbi:hypothetical protein MMC13_003192 [Lambiella insularis]|nr:hypothetical protein [Lambiella insularis]
MLAGQIARALAVFCVDEIVIFEDGQARPLDGSQIDHPNPSKGFEESGYTGHSNPNYFLMHLLSYLEAPPHLRTHLFPLHPDLRTAGTLPSLDMPHHLRTHEWCQYREGVTLKSLDPKGDKLSPEQITKKKKRKHKPSNAIQTPKTHVHAGYKLPVSISESIPPNNRVTLKFAASTLPQNFQNTQVTAEAVAPSAPREEAGFYWGYSVRSASSLSTVFTECVYDGGYDLTFGTSERGIPLASLASNSGAHDSIPEFKHMLVVIGGVAGLEAAVRADQELAKIDVTEPEKLFDHWVNLCPGQGSRTIRTEEAIWLGLTSLRSLVLEKGMKS